MAMYVFTFVSYRFPEILCTSGRGPAGLSLPQNEHDRRSDDERERESAQCSFIHQIVSMRSRMIQDMFRGASNRERCMLEENRDPDVCTSPLPIYVLKRCP